MLYVITRTVFFELETETVVDVGFASVPERTAIKRRTLKTAAMGRR
jgi:hypothetical protein